MMATTMWNRPLACVFLAGALLAAPTQAGAPRFARLGAFEGPVEVQMDAADSWRPATLNLPLSESARIRTGPAAKVEIELDDTSVFRMSGEGLAELSDYTRLSGGQHITVISLDHGLAYFTGEPGLGNAVHLLVPGAQASLKQGSRIRLQALDDASEIAILEGATHFTMPSAEMDLHQGQSARVTVPDSTHFSLFREIAPNEADRWSEQLDKAQAQAPASRLDLDRGGKWITAGDYGTVWQPAPQAGWAPFRQGSWIWFQSVGFTWVGAEPWGWKPYHEGRWLQHPDLGWVWVPASKKVDFSPGDVFWARGTNLAAWGPLAPAEQWSGAGAPRQFAAFNITGGTFVAGAREILPASPEDLPKDLLKAFLFTAALPSPPLPLARLNAPRDALRTRLFSAVDVAPAIPEVTQAIPPLQSDTQPPADVQPPAPAQQPTYAPPAPEADAPDVVYSYPVYTGIIVMNPPDKTDRPRKKPGTSTALAPPITVTPPSGGNPGKTGGSTGNTSGGGSTPLADAPAIHRIPPPEHMPDRQPVRTPEAPRTETKAVEVHVDPVSKPAAAAPAARVESKADPTPVKADAATKSK
jgi:FecR protein